MVTVEIFLIKQYAAGQDENLNTIMCERNIKILAEKKPATRAEFYKASEAGFKISLVLRVYSAEYSGEAIVELEGKRYKVVRSYEVNEIYTELSCEELK